MPNRRHLPVLPVLLSAAFLTACAPTMVPVTHLPVPTELLSCTAEPVPPVTGGDGYRVGGWILDLRDAGADCRSKLAAVGGIVSNR